MHKTNFVYNFLIRIHVGHDRTILHYALSHTTLTIHSYECALEAILGS